MKYIKTLSRIIKIISKKLTQMSVIKLKLLGEIAELEQKKGQLTIQMQAEHDLLLNNLHMSHTHDFYTFFSSIENKLKQLSADIAMLQDNLHKLLDDMHSLFIDQKRYEYIIDNAAEEAAYHEKLSEIQILDDINIRQYSQMN